MTLNIFHRKRQSFMSHRRARSMDNVDPEELIRQEKLSRQLHTPLMQVQRPSGRFFEQFLVVGCSPLQTAKDNVPTVLFRYPNNADHGLQALEEFCFPTGMGNYDVNKAEEAEKMYKSVVVYQSKNPQNSFVHMLTSEVRGILYAICVIDDYLKNFPSFIPPPSDPALLKSNYNRKRCYMFVTRYPFINLYFSVLYNILQAEEANISLQTDGAPSNAPNLVRRILETLYTTPVPPPGGCVDFGIDNIAPFQRPPIAEDDDISHLASNCLPMSFWALEKEHILLLTSAMLLEKKIVFISSDPRILSFTILGLLSLVRPFRLQCVIIPVLPESLAQITQAPVPFIIGLPSTRTLMSDTCKEAIVVDLDKKKLTCPPKMKIPPIPNAKELEKAFSIPVADLTKSFGGKPPYTPTESQGATALAISALFEQFFSPMFRRFKHHCVTNLTDRVTVFLKESYIAEEATDETQEFFENFFETQIFNVYCDKKLKEIDNFKEKRRLTKEEIYEKTEELRRASGSESSRASAAATPLASIAEEPSPENEPAPPVIKDTKKVKRKKTLSISRAARGKSDPPRRREKLKVASANEVKASESESSPESQQETKEKSKPEKDLNG